MATTDPVDRLVAKSDARLQQLTDAAKTSIGKTISEYRPALDRALQGRRDEGKPVSATWLDTQDVYRRRRADIRGTFRQLVADQRSAVDDVIREALQVGESEADRLAKKTLPDLREELIGQALGEGRPLGDRLRAHAGEAFTSVDELLVDAARRRLDPDKVATKLAALLEVDYHRARVIARTEIARTVREAQRLKWQRDDSILKWMWVARLDADTCAMCWMMHGSLHDLDEPMATHPACMCHMRPVTARTKPLQLGVTRFLKLSSDRQKEILGPGRYDLWKAGRLTLDDSMFTGLIVSGIHKDWGPTRALRPIRDIV